MTFTIGMSVPLRTDEDIEAAYQKGLLRKEALEHGSYYRGSCRNAQIARWHGRAQQFVHKRTKFGETFLERIRHPVDERNYDVFRVVERVEPAPEQIIDDDYFERFFDPRPPMDDDSD